MNSAQRVIHFFTGLIMLVCCVMILALPEEGYLVVILILDFTLLTAGIRQLIYFFSLARFMVGGGRQILYRAVILLDFGLFILYMDDVPQSIAMLYLLGGLLFAGAQDILHSMDRKKLKASFWRYEFAYGCIQVFAAVGSLFFLHSVRIMSAIFCIGLLHTAVSRIVTAFRKTAIIYIGEGADLMGASGVEELL